MTKSFFDFFPAPKFLEMPSPGLALTENGIKFLEFGKGKHGHIVRQYGEASLPPGTIESGIITNRNVLVKVLQDFRNQYGLEHVRTLLPEEQAYLFRTSITEAPDRDIKTSIEFSIEENVPISVADAVFDYTVLSSKPDGEAKISQVGVTVLPEKIVSDYLSVFREAGFSPLHFEVESQAISKAVVPVNDPSPILVINISLNKAGLYLVFQNGVAFSSSVPISLPEKIDLPSSDLEHKAEAAVNHVTDESGGGVYMGLDTTIEEIKKILLYWGSQTDYLVETHGIEKIIVCGQESYRPGITDYFFTKLRIATVLGNVWVNTFSFKDYIPEISLKDSLGYASAVGLALSHKQQIVQ
jgi:Tfp pilus assembly PilM family ATPase